MNRHLGDKDDSAPVETSATTEPAPTESAEERVESTETQPAAVETTDDAPFRLEDVPQEYREHVERYGKQLQGAFTRKTQQLAEQRKELEAAAALYERLHSDDTRAEAIRELLEANGYEIEESGDDSGNATVTDQSELERRVAQIESRHTADQEAEYVRQVEDHIESGLEKLAESLGVDELPQAAREHVLAVARTLEPIDGLWPDMDGAIASYEAWRAAEIQAYVNSKKAPVVDTSGTDGHPQVNLRDPKERLKAMEAIVGRHL